MPDELEEYRKILSQYGDKTQQTLPAAPVLYVDGFPQMESQKERKKAKKLDVYHANDIYNKKLERPPVIIDGLLPAGLTVIAGAPKRGKSWLALTMGIAVAQGTPFLGMPTKQGDVLYLDLESRQYRIQDRLSKLLPGAGPHNLHIAHEAERLDTGLLEQLKMWTEEPEITNPVLAIIDTFGRVKGQSKRGETAYEADTRIMGGIQSFAMDHKMSIVLVHHLRKTQTAMGTNDDYFEKISGSMGITGACDAVMVLSGKRGAEDTTLNITGRDYDPVELVLAFKGGIWTLKSTNSEVYQEEQQYLQSPVVRAVIALMHTRDRWEGTPSNLLKELCCFTSFDMKPDVMTKELQRFRERLHDRECIFVRWYRNSKSRFISVSKVDENEF